MDILDAIEKGREARHLLEIEISEYLAFKARLFQDSYGISLKGIKVFFVDVTNMESRCSQYVLQNVEIDLGGI